MNGFRWHATPTRFAKDQERLRRLAALGCLALPATPLDLAGDGRELAAQVVISNAILVIVVLAVLNLA